MRALSVLCMILLLAVGLPGCSTTDKEAKTKAKQKEKDKKPKPSMPDVSQDTNFQAFLGRLRIAAAKRDRATLQGMMADGFGWRWDNPEPGSTPFQYWDEHNGWSELVRVLNHRFVPHEDFMVAPPEFATDSSYQGARAGIKLVNGSWRFVYFLLGPDILP